MGHSLREEWEEGGSERGREGEEGGSERGREGEEG